MRTAAALILILSTAAGAEDLPVQQVAWRYDEDWSVLQSTKVDNPPWWLPAKYVPLNASGSDWISFGLDSRIRFEGLEGNNWGSAKDDGYLWTRIMPHADLHVGPARLFVEGIAGFSRGVAGGPGPIDQTGFDLMQEFAEVRAPITSEVSLTLRAGRELMPLGNQRLIGIRYGVNIPQPFDGVRARLSWGALRVDAFRAHPVEIRRHDFDDKEDKGRRLSGFYATIPLKKVGDGAGLDAYFISFRRSHASFDQGPGAENRRTFGTRVYGRSRNWRWDWEAMLQRGRFASARIRAWSIQTETSRSFPKLPLSPMLRLRANVASGDKDPAKPKLQTFNPMFPKAEYFGELSPIGPYNIININPAVEFDLGHGFNLGFAGHTYWRQSRRDGVYDIAGGLIRSGRGGSARFIGTQEEAVLDWQPKDALSFTASYSLFQPGRFIDESGPARTIHMIGLESQYRF